MEPMGDHWELFDTLSSKQKERLRKIIKRKQEERAAQALNPDEDDTLAAILL